MEEFWGSILGVIIVCAIMFLIDYFSEKQYENELTQPDEIKYIKKDDVLDNYIAIFTTPFCLWLIIYSLEKVLLTYSAGNGAKSLPSQLGIHFLDNLVSI